MALKNNKEEKITKNSSEINGKLDKIRENRKERGIRGDLGTLGLFIVNYVARRAKREKSGILEKLVGLAG